MDQTTSTIDHRLVETVRAWASERPPISRAWIFGSRAKGSARHDSDLDVAVEVEPAHGLTARETYEHDLRWLEWEDDLAQEVDLKLHLVLRDGDRTPTTDSGVREGGILVFDRATG